MRSTAALPTSDVLVIEDDDDLREALSELLWEEGYTVSQAANGQEALLALRSGGTRPRLILVDLMMPVMDGWEFCAEQMKDPELSAIPVGVISALGPSVKLPYRINDAGRFHKPGDPIRLLQLVASYCATRS
jgi:CheY-like chemotaxis protein